MATYTRHGKIVEQPRGPKGQFQRGFRPAGSRANTASTPPRPTGREAVAVNPTGGLGAVFGVDLGTTQADTPPSPSQEGLMKINPAAATAQLKKRAPQALGIAAGAAVARMVKPTIEKLVPGGAIVKRVGSIAVRGLVGGALATSKKELVQGAGIGMIVEATADTVQSAVQIAKGGIQGVRRKAARGALLSDSPMRKQLPASSRGAMSRGDVEAGEAAVPSATTRSDGPRPLVRM